MLFVLPLVASLAACTYFWLASDMGKFWKLLASGALLAAIAMQFTSLRESVSFLVPTLIEVVVAIWGAFVMKLDQA